MEAGDAAYIDCALEERSVVSQGADLRTVDEVVGVWPLSGLPEAALAWRRWEVLSDKRLGEDSWLSSTVLSCVMLFRMAWISSSNLSFSSTCFWIVSFSSSPEGSGWDLESEQGVTGGLESVEAAKVGMLSGRGVATAGSVTASGRLT